ncbi:hypothetical protein Dimus_027217 [Dionaea muscipula]
MSITKPLTADLIFNDEHAWPEGRAHVVHGQMAELRDKPRRPSPGHEGRAHVEVAQPPQQAELGKESVVAIAEHRLGITQGRAQTRPISFLVMGGLRPSSRVRGAWQRSWKPILEKTSSGTPSLGSVGSLPCTGLVGKAEELFALSSASREATPIVELKTMEAELRQSMKVELAMALHGSRA